MTPLYSAVMEENIQAIRLLIRHGCDINKKDINSDAVASYLRFHFMNSRSLNSMLFPVRFLGGRFIAPWWNNISKQCDSWFDMAAKTRKTSNHVLFLPFLQAWPLSIVLWWKKIFKLFDSWFDMVATSTRKTSIRGLHYMQLVRTVSLMSPSMSFYYFLSILCILSIPPPPTSLSLFLSLSLSPSLSL